MSSAGLMDGHSCIISKEGTQDHKLTRVNLEDIEPGSYAQMGKNLFRDTSITSTQFDDMLGMCEL
jgi:hypothetical protein